MRAEPTVLRAGGGRPGANAPWLTASWLLAASLATFVPGAASWCEWTRPGSEGAPALGTWLLSLVTCHFAHFNASHWTWNALVLAATGVLVERTERRALLAASLFATLAIPLVLPLVDPSLASYRGASGVASAWFTLALVHGWRRMDSSASRALLALGATLHVAKVLVEWSTSAACFADPGASGFRVAPAAHAIGAVCGACGGLAGSVAKPRLVMRHRPHS